MENVKEKEILQALIEERKEIINTINYMNRYVLYKTRELEKESENDTKRN